MIRMEISGSDSLKKIKVGRYLIILVIIILLIILANKLGIRRESIIVITNEINLKNAYKRDYKLYNNEIAIAEKTKIQMMEFSGNQKWEKSVDNKKIYLANSGIYEYDFSGIIEKDDLEDGKFKWAIDLGANIQWIKEEGNYLFVISKEKNNGTLGIVIDIETGTPILNKTFENEQLIKLGIIGKNFYGTTLRMGQENLYSNFYEMNDKGDFLVQKNFEQEVLIKTEAISKHEILIYTDEKIYLMKDSVDVWEYSLSDTIIDYDYDSKNKVITLIKSKNPTHIEKVSIKDEMVTSVNIDDELYKNIKIDNSMFHIGNKNIYKVDGSNNIYKMYMFDSKYYDVEVNKNVGLIVYKDYIQLIKLTHKITGGK